MKTILTLNGNSFLIPNTKDITKLLEAFQGCTAVQSQTLYGPEGPARYDSAFYVSKYVQEVRPQPIRVEVVHDEEVVSWAEWESYKASHAKRSDDFQAKALAEASAPALLAADSVSAGS
jgi:hypothetical protein